eukprot:2369742-Prymnesium_polylepis.1
MSDWAAAARRTGSAGWARASGSATCPAAPSPGRSPARPAGVLPGLRARVGGCRGRTSSRHDTCRHVTCHMQMCMCMHMCMHMSHGHGHGHGLGHGHGHGGQGQWGLGCEDQSGWGMLRASGGCGGNEGRAV